MNKFIERDAEDCRISQYIHKGQNINIGERSNLFKKHDLNNLEGLFVFDLAENMFMFQNQLAYWNIEIRVFMVEVKTTSKCIFYVLLV